MPSSHRSKKTRPACRRKSPLKKIIHARAPLSVVRSATHAPKSSQLPAAAPGQKANPRFASLDFPGRETLSPREVAQRIGCSIDHIYDLIFEGQLHAIDIAGRNNSTHRRSLRVPLESWRQFLADRTV